MILGQKTRIEKKNGSNRAPLTSRTGRGDIGFHRKLPCGRRVVSRNDQPGYPPPTALPSALTLFLAPPEPDTSQFTLLISHPIGSACQFRGESPPLLRLKVPSLSSWIDPVSMFRVLILGFSLAACRGRGCTDRSGLRRRLAHQPPRGHGRTTQVPFRSPALSSGSALSQNRTPT